MSRVHIALSLLPRSLWAQTILLLSVAVIAAGAVVAPIASGRFSRQFEEELDKKGQNFVNTLEKHSDLRLAISLRDKDQASPVLSDMVKHDPDVIYAAALGRDRSIIAAVPPDFDKEELKKLIGKHFSSGMSAAATQELRRFTRELTTESTLKADMGAFDPLTGEAIPTQAGDAKETLGYVVLGLSRQEAVAQAKTMVLVAVGAGSLVLFMTLMLLYVRWISQRMMRMVQFAQAIAAGDLTQSLDDAVGDDIGQLAATLRVMSESTRSVVGQLIGAAGSLSEASTELLASASRQATHATGQATSVSEVASTVTELRETFARSTETTESVIALARRSEESSAGGIEAVQQSIVGIDEVQKQVTEIARNITSLVQRTEQIDAIIEVVSDLAEQSNVLAINAGIEAARAGEQGRGFAVVAREVRSLAERSKESTSQVRNILQDIKTASKDTAHAIEEGQRRAESSSLLAKASGDTIEKMGEIIASSSSSAMEIAASIRQQAAGVDQIWNAVHDLDLIASEAKGGAQQIEGNAGTMKQLSGSMSEVVGRYRMG